VRHEAKTHDMIRTCRSLGSDGNVSRLVSDMPDSEDERHAAKTHDMIRMWHKRHADKTRRHDMTHDMITHNKMTHDMITHNLITHDMMTRQDDLITHDKITRQHDMMTHDMMTHDLINDMTRHDKITRWVAYRLGDSADLGAFLPYILRALPYIMHIADYI
jgi:hypothetical protein